MLVTAVGLMVTKLVDTVRNAVGDTGDKPKALWNVLAIVLGIVVCVLWRVDAFEALEAGTRVGGVPGEVFTGFVVAGVSSGWHEVLDNISSGAKAKAPKKGTAGK